MDGDVGYNFNELNLDFIEWTAPVRQHGSATGLKASEVAKRIADCDSLIRKLQHVEAEQTKQQQELRDFQNVAKEIQTLYESEKQQRCSLQTQLEVLQCKCNRLDDDLAHKTLQYDQLQAQWDAAKGPLDYCDLALKYLKLAHKLDMEQSLHWTEKSLMTELRKHCEEKGYTGLPLPKSPKKRVRITKSEKAVQCLLLKEQLPPSPSPQQPPSVVAQKETCNQSTQCVEDTPTPKDIKCQGTQCEGVKTRTQSTQHISTTTTRSTSTACFIKQHNVGTCFPERKPLPPLDDILAEMDIWNNIAPLSPIAELRSPTPPLAQPQPALIERRTVGTCTLLCNVQRQIDFMPSLTAIKRSHSRSPSRLMCEDFTCKQETFVTPSQSPPPHLATTAAGDTAGGVFASSFPQLAQLQPNVFSTFWQMVGQMLLGLLHPTAGNEGASRSNTSTSIPTHVTAELLNHQNLHRWMYASCESMQENLQRTRDGQHNCAPSSFSQKSDIGELEVLAQTRGETANATTNASINDPQFNMLLSGHKNSINDIEHESTQAKREFANITQNSCVTDTHPKSTDNDKVQESVSVTRLKCKQKKKKWEKSRRLNAEAQDDLEMINSTNSMLVADNNTLKSSTNETKLKSRRTKKHVGKKASGTTLIGQKQQYSDTVTDNVNPVEETQQSNTLDHNNIFYNSDIETANTVESIEGMEKNCITLESSKAEGFSRLQHEAFDDIEMNKDETLDEKQQQKVEWSDDTESNLSSSISASTSQDALNTRTSLEDSPALKILSPENISTVPKQQGLADLTKSVQDITNEKSQVEDGQSCDSVLIIDENVSNEYNPWPNKETETPVEMNEICEEASKLSTNHTTDSDNTNDSDSSISELISNSLLEDILANKSMCEMVDTVLPLEDEAVSFVPNNAVLAKQRGRKRKTEIGVGQLVCKRSARLRNKQLQVKTNAPSEQQALRDFEKRALDLSHKVTKALADEVSAKNSKPIAENCDVSQTAMDDGETTLKPQFSIYENKVESKQEIAHCITLSREQIRANFQSSVQRHLTILEKQKSNKSYTDSTVANENQQCTWSEVDSAPCATADDKVTLEQPPAVLIERDISSTLPCSVHLSYDAPASPSGDFFPTGPTTPPKDIPSELHPAYLPRKRNSILERLIAVYSADQYQIVNVHNNARDIEQQHSLETQIQHYLSIEHSNVDSATASLVRNLDAISCNIELIAASIVAQIKIAPRPEIELACTPNKVPVKYQTTQLKKITVALQHLQYTHTECPNAVLAKIESTLFQYQNSDVLSLNEALNLTQLYLLTIPIQYGNSQSNPARLFVAKCLYYYNLKAIPMVYEVLSWYPTTLPHREDRSYDRSDALITVIQHVLMCTSYNMNSTDLRTKELLSMLRYQYHYQPYKPDAGEVLANLLAKLKAGRLSNLKYAFAVFCKRMPPEKVIADVLQAHLVPLASEYYQLVLQTCAYDERAAALLECLSVIVKPMPLDTDISIYLAICERFLSAVQRPVVQEAAVLSILRLQRFDHISCFRALRNFRPTYVLQPLTKNVLKTFVHRRPLKLWKQLLEQTAV